MQVKATVGGSDKSIPVYVKASDLSGLKLPEKKTAAAALADVKLPTKRRQSPYTNGAPTPPTGKGKRRKSKDGQINAAAKPVLVLGRT